MSQSQIIHVLTGCTAVGKTETALRWAEANDAEIVNCDSLLFYRGMNVGTAKPSAEELERVPHHLIDLMPVDQQMDVGRYVELAIEAVRDISSRGKQVLVTGGSGFYLKAFFGPVVDEVQVSDEIRTEVAQLEAESGVVGIAMRLEDLSPDCVGQVDLNNPRRVARALERCLASGLTVTELKKRFAEQRNLLIDSEKCLAVLERDKGELAERISQRIGLMLEAGLVAEVSGLLEAGIESNSSAATAIGYRETIAHLKGDLSLEQLSESIATNTRRLAKKQRTWFRGQLPKGKVHFLEGNLEVDVGELFG